MINANPEQHRDPQVSSKSAWQFVILIGVVSLFGDMTYEAPQSPGWRRRKGAGPLTEYSTPSSAFPGFSGAS